MKVVPGYEPYIDLANAIIKQAVRDYTETIRRLQKRPDSCSLKAKLAELEEFFFSEWFMLLTDMDPKTLLQLVREHMKEE